MPQGSLVKISGKQISSRWSRAFYSKSAGRTDHWICSPGLEVEKVENSSCSWRFPRLSLTFKNCRQPGRERKFGLNTELLVFITSLKMPTSL